MEWPSASAATAIALTLCSLLVLGWHVGALGPVALGVLAGGAFVATGALGGRDELPTVAAGSLLYLPAAALSLATVAAAVAPALASGGSTGALAERAVLSGTFAVAAVLATYGAFSIPRSGSVPRDARAIVGSGTYVAGAVGLALAAALVLWVLEGVAPIAAALETLDPLREALLSPADWPPPVGTFLVVVGVWSMAIAVFLGSLPIAVFAARERRERVRVAVERLQGRLVLAGFLFVVVGPALVFVPEELWIEVAEELPAGVYGPTVALAASEGVRSLLLRIAVLALVVPVGVWLLKRLRTDYVAGPARHLARAAGGVALLGGLFLVGPGAVLDRIAAALPEAGRELLGELVVEFGAAIPVLTGVLAALAAVALLVSVLGALGFLRLIPPATAGAVLAGLGVGIASLAAGLLVGPSPIPFATVAAGVVAWDVGAYERRLREEVGADAPTRRVELVHGGATLAVGAGGAVVVYVLATSAPGLVGDAGLAGIAALVGAILLLSALRG